MQQRSRAGGFRRQVVFRLDQDEWRLLERAVATHGSIQAAVIAALQALDSPQRQSPPAPASEADAASSRPAASPSADAEATASDPLDPDEEITAREAAQLLELKPDTVRAYIRTHRIAGRYDAEPTWRGWLTTRRAVTDYIDRRR